MAVALVTGSYPPDICGVGDYTYKLYTNSNSSDWKLCHIKDWNIKSVISIINTSVIF